MKKKLISSLLVFTMVAGLLTGCSGGASDSGSGDSSESENQSSEESGELQKVVIAANPLSGQVLDAISTDRGFYEEEGIEVEINYCNSNEDAFTALSTGHADLVSTYGTGMPLQYIGNGEDLTIFAGYMLEGAMTLITKPGVEINDASDLDGMKVAGNISDYCVSWPAEEAGATIEWVEIPEHQDRLQAVANGEVDAMVGTTGIDYNARELGLEVAAYCDDLMPEYSCCRAACRTEWLEENPEAVKGLLKAWIRALNVLQTERDYAIDLMTETLDLDRDYCANYMENEHWNINVDPDLYAVSRAWYAMGQLGLLSDDSLETLQAHYNSEIYKEALDECVETYYDENPEYYDGCLTFYEENNRLYEAYE
ncbi:hypothetical protein FND36_12355 [Lachnospiraceae bacterium KGMB03038]|nr:hypothetical protein FND36_12355 [Lachnospiraceae bacterium KGMB03038]